MSRCPLYGIDCGVVKFCVAGQDTRYSHQGRKERRKTQESTGTEVKWKRE